MQFSTSNNGRLKVRPDTQTLGTFELKASDGRSLGFVLNGDGTGPSFVIAGIGSAARSVFQQVLLWPATRGLNGRLALILLDRIDGNHSADALEDVTHLLAPVKGSIFLTPIDAEHSASSQAALETIENFCKKHGLLPARAGELDCASL